MAVDRGNEQLKWVINSLFRRIRPHAHYAFTVYLLRLFLVESVALPVPYLYPYPYLPLVAMATVISTAWIALTAGNHSIKFENNN